MKLLTWTGANRSSGASLRPRKSGTRDAGGQWAASAVAIDQNPGISRAVATALPDGTTHVFALVPGSGIWHRTRDAAGRWDASAGVSPIGLVSTSRDQPPSGRTHG